jgi:hypothetical protein
VVGSGAGMSLQERCGHEFPLRVQARGAAYAKQRRVTLEALSPELVEARARGTEEYRLRLVVDRAVGLLVACSCPYAADRPCKHLWALLIELDRTRPGEYEASGRGPMLVGLAEGDWEDEPEEVAVVGDEDGRPEGWRERLRSIHHPRGCQPAGPADHQ